MRKENIRNSLLLQVALLFLVATLAIGALTHISQRRISAGTVTRGVEGLAEEVAGEVSLSVREYPAWQWLLSYWYEHPEELDIDYDEEYLPGTRTEEKCRTLADKYPGIQLRYLDAETLEGLPEEDQKLCAEIIYSWLITRINQIKRSHQIDFLFCVLTEPPYDRQFFLFSGADPGAVRGTNYEEVYILGTTVQVEESQREAMENAVAKRSHLADAGSYVDFYSYLDSVDGHDILIGITYSLQGLQTNIRTQTRQGTIVAVSFLLVLSSLSLILILAYVIRPLRKVQQNIRLFKDSKDSEAVTRNLARVRPHNEIGELSRNVSDLAQELDDHVRRIADITAERQRVSTELDMAYHIQEGMLPSIFPAFPDRNEFDIYAANDPAREVGGDFYDYFLIDDDHLCIEIADVSGKGVPAALFMMASKIILANNAIQGKDPAQILADTNNALCANNPEEMFVTVWLGILEISTGKLTAANAGHEYPAIKRAGEGFELVRDRHGIVLGAFEGARFTSYELQLEPGTELFLYTDGVPEASDKEGKMFGIQSMLAALNAEPCASPETLLENVRSTVDGFSHSAEQFDDLTMLCLEYLGPDPTLL